MRRATSIDPRVCHSNLSHDILCTLLPIGFCYRLVRLFYPMGFATSASLHSKSTGKNDISISLYCTGPGYPSVVVPLTTTPIHDVCSRHIMYWRTLDSAIADTSAILPNPIYLSTCLLQNLLDSYVQLVPTVRRNINHVATTMWPLLWGSFPF